MKSSQRITFCFVILLLLIGAGAQALRSGLAMTAEECMAEVEAAPANELERRFFNIQMGCRDGFLTLTHQEGYEIAVFCTEGTGTSLYEWEYIGELPSTDEEPVGCNPEAILGLLVELGLESALDFALVVHDDPTEGWVINPSDSDEGGKETILRCSGDMAVKISEHQPQVTGLILGEGNGCDGGPTLVG